MSISEKKVTAAVYEYFESILAGSEFTYVYRAPETTELNDKRSALLEELQKLSLREQRIRLAFENGIDTLEEYGENKKRLKTAREELEKKLAELEMEPAAHKPTKEEALAKVHSIYDIIKDPDIDYETKGNAMRSLIESITYDKENQSLEFVLYVS